MDSTIAWVFVAAVLVNLPWELVQAALGLFAGISGRQALLCVVCTVGDGVLVVLIYAAGWLAFGRQDWFENPGPAEYAVMVTSGASAAIIVEWGALGRSRWRYSARMPLIPGVRVGLTPVLQMILLPPVIFYLVAALRHG